MTIDAIENGTRVVTPEGWTGRVSVTRLERQLISKGLQHWVNFVSDEGQRSLQRLRKLTEIAPEPVEETAAMPLSLTAENGAKALLSGEFAESLTLDCPACAESGGAHPDCDTCGGFGVYEYPIPVSWTNIKAIYAAAVKHFTEGDAS